MCLVLTRHLICEKIQQYKKPIIRNNKYFYGHDYLDYFFLSFLVLFFQRILFMTEQWGMRILNDIVRLDKLNYSSHTGTIDSWSHYVMISIRLSDPFQNAGDSKYKVWVHFITIIIPDIKLNISEGIFSSCENLKVTCVQLFKKAFQLESYFGQPRQWSVLVSFKEITQHRSFCILASWSHILYNDTFVYLTLMQLQYNKQHITRSWHFISTAVKQLQVRPMKTTKENGKDSVRRI